MVFPERHLGLHLAEETLTEHRLGALAECVESHVDLDRLLSLGARPRAAAPLRTTARDTCVRIGIARDAGFCFYYEANLELLRACGAELVEFSPIADRALPDDLGGIYFGGGYPELYAESLAANSSMRQAVADFVARDGPVYAECGGFMYLTESIVDLEGRAWPMVGIFPTRARMQARLAKLGYIEVETDSGLARGHEYRHSTVDEMPADTYRVHAALGSYVHLHFLSCPQFAEEFVDRCEKWPIK